jgi:NADPH:quinone reductase-like Zn-dependent oxidoreductase
MSDSADVPMTIQALVLKGPGVLEMREVPTPAPAGDAVPRRVRVRAICGTDPKIVKGRGSGSSPVGWGPTW